MVGLQRRVFNRGQNVVPLEEWIVGENPLKRGSGAEQMQDVHHPNTLAADRRAPAALVRLDGNPLEELRVHCLCPECHTPPAHTGDQPRELPQCSHPRPEVSGLAISSEIASRLFGSYPILCL